MKKAAILISSLLATAFFPVVFPGLSTLVGQGPWTEKQLMQPSELAWIINEGTEHDIYVFSVGPVGLIKNSVDIGECKDKGNLHKLKKELDKLPKDADIVIYCGCCPFKDCPNIRPAFNLLNKMKFTNHKLLNLPHNIKADWLDYGYPVNE